MPRIIVITPSLRASIVAALRNGHSRVRAAADAGVPVHRVDAIAQDEGIVRADRWRTLDADRRAAAERLVRAGLQNSEIERRLRMSKETVKRVRQEMANG